MSGLDFVYQFDRIAFGRDQIEPAPRHHQARWQTQHAISDGVAMMVVIKQPSVDIALAQGGLDRREVHGQTSIVNKRTEFGRMVTPCGRAHRLLKTQTARAYEPGRGRRCKVKGLRSAARS